MNQDNLHFEILTSDNFNLASLDTFIRHQVVTECWRCVDHEWKLVAVPFTEEWSHEELRRYSQQICDHIRRGMVNIGAFVADELVGFVMLGQDLFGSEDQYLELIEFEVSEPYRGKGIGKRLFSIAVSEAKKKGAKKLYISAHSSKESQAAYRCLGCRLAEEINQANVEKEPCDVQMEYLLADSKISIQRTA